MYHIGWGLGLWGGLVGLAVVVIVVLLVALFVRAVSRPSLPPAGGRDGAHEILRERFARGEINAAEFEEGKRTLGIK